jgi:hypothetical protein
VLANPDSELDLVCLSGRGDKDLVEFANANSIASFAGAKLAGGQR